MRAETSRRTIIAVLAAASAIRYPTISQAIQENDPVISAFAEYERRQAVADAAWSASFDAEKAFTTALKECLPAHEKVRHDCRWEAAEAAAGKAQIEADNAQRVVFETTPISPAGAIILLRHAADHLDEIGVDDSLLEDVFTDAIRNALAILERQTTQA